MHTPWTLVVVAALSLLFPAAHAACPTCPKNIPMGEKGQYVLLSQNSGYCSYYSFGFQFVCAYYFTGELSTAVPGAYPICLKQVPRTEEGCKFYTGGGIHD